VLRDSTIVEQAGGYTRRRPRGEIVQDYTGWAPIPELEAGTNPVDPRVRTKRRFPPTSPEGARRAVGRARPPTSRTGIARTD
jgi:hypothetical protein